MVASMGLGRGELAATGSRCRPTEVFAEPETITGSIGIFGVLPSFQGSLEKLGVGADGVKTTPLSGEPNLLEGPSPAANRLLQMGVENSYRQFIAIVAAARKMPPEKVDQVAQGRVWDGGTARQLGLVDAFGSTDAAIAEAARLAKLDPAGVQTVYLEKGPDYLERLLKMMARDDQEEAGATDAFSRAAQKPQLLLMRALHDARKILSGPRFRHAALNARRWRGRFEGGAAFADRLARRAPRPLT
jgi:protease-4